MGETQPLVNQFNANGMREGVWEERYDNGAIKTIWTYKNGRLDGLVENFSINGICTMRAEFKDGVFHGTVEFFDDEGNLINRSKQVHGEYVEDPTNFIAVTGDRPQTPKP